MTEALKIGIPTTVGVTNPKPVIEALSQAVNLLQGVSDQDQRAVRQFEFETRMSEVEARLKAAGF